MSRLKTNSERKSENVKELLQDYWESLELSQDSEKPRPFEREKPEARKTKR